MAHAPLVEGNRRVLVVNDEPHIRRVLEAALGSGGFDVMMASDGVQGLDELGRKAFGLVILDLMMPNKTGLEAYFEISAFDASVPVVFSSGFNESDLMQQLPPRTRAIFLKKPYLASDLRQFVESLIEGHR